MTLLDDAVSLTSNTAVSAPSNEKFETRNVQLPAMETVPLTLCEMVFNVVTAVAQSLLQAPTTNENKEINKKPINTATVKRSLFLFRGSFENNKENDILYCLFRDNDCELSNQ